MTTAEVFLYMIFGELKSTIRKRVQKVKSPDDTPVLSIMTSPDLHSLMSTGRIFCQVAAGLSKLQAEIPLNTWVSRGVGNLNPLNLPESGQGLSDIEREDWSDPKQPLWLQVDLWDAGLAHTQASSSPEPECCSANSH